MEKGYDSDTLTLHTMSVQEYIRKQRAELAKGQQQSGTKGTEEGQKQKRTEADLMYDVVIVDLPDPRTASLARLYTREALASYWGLVRPGGMLSMQATSPFLWRSAYWCLVHTLQSIDKKIHVRAASVNLPSTGEWGFLLASSDRAIVDPVLPPPIVHTRYLTEITSTIFVELPLDVGEVPTSCGANDVERDNLKKRIGLHGVGAGDARNGPGSTTASDFPSTEPIVLTIQQRLHRMDLPKGKHGDEGSHESSGKGSKSEGGAGRPQPSTTAHSLHVEMGSDRYLQRRQQRCGVSEHILLVHTPMPTPMNVRAETHSCSNSSSNVSANVSAKLSRDASGGASGGASVPQRKRRRRAQSQALVAAQIAQEAAAAAAEAAEAAAAEAGGRNKGGEATQKIHKVEAENSKKGKRGKREDQLLVRMREFYRRHNPGKLLRHRKLKQYPTEVHLLAVAFGQDSDGRDGGEVEECEQGGDHSPLRYSYYYCVQAVKETVEERGARKRREQNARQEDMNRRLSMFYGVDLKNYTKPLLVARELMLTATTVSEAAMVDVEAMQGSEKMGMGREGSEAEEGVGEGAADAMVGSVVLSVEQQDAVHPSSLSLYWDGWLQWRSDDSHRLFESLVHPAVHFKHELGEVEAKKVEKHRLDEEEARAEEEERKGAKMTVKQKARREREQRKQKRAEEKKRREREMERERRKRRGEGGGGGVEEDVDGARWSVANVLVLGGGDGMAAAEALKYPSVKKVDIVDADEGMIMTGTKPLSQGGWPQLQDVNRGSLMDPRVRIHHTDARSFAFDRGEEVAKARDNERDKRKLKQLQDAEEKSTARRRAHEDKQLGKEAKQDGDKDGAEDERSGYSAGGKAQKLAKARRRREQLETEAKRSSRTRDSVWQLQYDVVIVDLPDPRTASLARLYTREALASYWGLVRPGGMLSMQATSPFLWRSAFWCLVHTLQSVVGVVQVIPLVVPIPSLGERGILIATPEEVDPAAFEPPAFVKARYLTTETTAHMFHIPEDSGEVPTNLNEDEPPVQAENFTQSWVLDLEEQPQGFLKGEETIEGDGGLLLSKEELVVKFEGEHDGRSPDDDELALYTKSMFDEAKRQEKAAHQKHLREMKQARMIRLESRAMLHTLFNLPWQNMNPKRGAHSPQC
jgi:predicted membrane-bound spermidine synthase